MNQPVILREWEVISDSNPWTAPEIAARALRGKAENHPNFPRGELIHTSPITGADGCVITCVSRQYLLDGPPSPNYAAYLASIGREIDPKNPIKEFKQP